MVSLAQETKTTNLLMTIHPSPRTGPILYKFEEQQAVTTVGRKIAGMNTREDGMAETETETGIEIEVLGIMEDIQDKFVWSLCFASKSTFNISTQHYS